MKKRTGCNIGVEGAKKISKALMTNTTLSTLDIMCDEIKMYGIN